MSHPLAASRKTVKRWIAWYENSKRPLPWRETRDPYAIWISEIMLQQTQVAAVIPYWQRWMKRFPDIQALSQAPLKAVLKHWEGLGYYSRARNLHQAAKQLAAGKNATFPSTFTEVLSLPGIGRYTAGAICSIAYSQPHPVVDGNVIRVISRLTGLRKNTRLPEVRESLWKLAEEWLKQATRLGIDPGDWNQAVMELGATVCLPRSPRCESCPVQSGCSAAKSGSWETIPNRGQKQKTTAVEKHALVITDGKRWLLRQKLEGGRHAGLWEFPEFDAEAPGEKSEWLKQFGLSLEKFQAAGEIRHSVTRFRIRLIIFTASTSKKVSSTPQSCRWFFAKEVSDLPLPAAHGKIRERFCESKKGD